MDELADGAPELAVEVLRREGGTVVVKLTGELDISTVERAADAVAPELAERPDLLVVDAGGLLFADSSAIALWLQWANHVHRLEIQHASSMLRRVIERMGLAEKLRLP